MTHKKILLVLAWFSITK